MIELARGQAWKSWRIRKLAATHHAATPSGMPRPMITGQHPNYADQGAGTAAPL